MIMKLTLKDKIILSGLLPKEGSFEKLIIINDIQKKLTLTQEEIVEYEVETITIVEKQSIKWNEKWINAEFEIEFSEIELKNISDTFLKLSEENKLTMDLLDLYKLFVK